MATNDDLEKRIHKLENQSALKFFVQYLLSPLLIISVGAFINWNIERNKAENQRLELAQKMIPTLFGGKPEEALATEKLMAKILDKEVAKEFSDLVVKFNEAHLAEGIKQGDLAGVKSQLAAAKTIGGDAAKQIIDSVAQNPEQSNRIKELESKSESASEKEREGYLKLIEGDYESAITAFQEAENTFNSYHQVYEIVRFLKSRKQDLKDPARRTAVFQEILNKYSAYAPKDLLSGLKSLAGQ